MLSLIADEMLVTTLLKAMKPRVSVKRRPKRSSLPKFWFYPKQRAVAERVEPVIKMNVLQL